MDTTETTYNGWANRSTWLIPLWVDNDYDTYCAKLAMLEDLDGPVSGHDAFAIAVQLWHGTDEVDWDVVDWDRIAEHWEAERLEGLES